MPAERVRNAEKTACGAKKGAEMKSETRFASIIHGKVLKILDIPDFTRSWRSLVGAFFRTRLHCHHRKFSTKMPAFPVA
jgi:hypothetical protein